MDVRDVEFEQMMNDLVEKDMNSAQQRFGSSYTTLCSSLEHHQKVESIHKKAMYGIVMPLIALFMVANVWLINNMDNDDQTLAQENYEEENVDFFAEITDF